MASSESSIGEQICETDVVYVVRKDARADRCDDKADGRRSSLLQHRGRVSVHWAWADDGRAIK